MCKPTTTPDIKKHLPCRYVVLTPVRCGICAWVAGILVLMLAYGCANKVSPRASGKALRFEPQRDHLEKGTDAVPFSCFIQLCYSGDVGSSPAGMVGFCARRAQRTLFQTHSALTDEGFYTIICV